MFDTSNGGKLLNALGFTKNIKSGDMKINIKFWMINMINMKEK